MQFAISFLEGIITFISPCLLPLLPIYISYFAGGQGNPDNIKTLKNAIGFVLGFTIVFTLMGAFAGTLGSFLKEYQIAVNIVSGIVVIIFGLNFLGFLRISLFKGMRTNRLEKELGFLSSFVFGMVFSIGWTPCVGAFLGSALMLASQQGSASTGILMLLCYSLGLGIPFIISAIIIDKLKNTFDFIKKHYHIITQLSGILLIVVGVMMMTGTMGFLLSMFSV